MSTISTKLLRLLVAGAAAAGVPPEVLLAAAEVSADKLADPDGRMTFDCQHRLWEQAARLSGDALGKYWKYRIGDWRLVCEIIDQRVVVRVLRIGHRGNIYNK